MVNNSGTLNFLMMQGKVQQFGLWICIYKALEFELPRLTRHLLTGESEAFPVLVNIFHNLIYFPANSHPTPLSSSLRYSHDQFSIPFARTNHFKYSFLPNSISLWTNLSLEAVNCTTLSMFKYYTLPLFL